MRARWVVAVLVATVVGLAGCGGDDGTDTAEGSSRNIEVSDAIVGEPAGENAALYLTVRNRGARGDALVGATTDIAERVETHETVMKDGRMTMRLVPGGFDVPAGGSLELAPGGMHLMLFGVSQIAAGDNVDFVLQFENAGEVQITAVVRSLDDLEGAGSTSESGM